MTSLVFDAGGRIVHHHAGELGAGIGLIAILLVIFIVVERELLRSLGGAAARARVRATTPILYPLLITFVFVVGARLGQLT
jgi:hypothetical protein